MAERRMFTQKIIDSDAFLDMPLSSQALYFHLNMRADDDGFVNNPKRIQRTIGASEDDLKLLVAKRFVIGFESGVLVIKHWRMHNTLRKDRYSPTQYQEELALLNVKGNNAYTEKDFPLPELPTENVATEWQPNGNQLATQYSIGKDIIGKVILDNVDDSDESQESPQKQTTKKKPTKQKYGEYGNVLLTDAEFEKLTEDYGSNLLNKAISFLDAYIEEKGYKSKSHNLAIRRWVVDAVSKNAGNKRKEIVPNGCTDEYEEMVQSYVPVYKKKTAADDEGIRARAEEMKRKLSAKDGD